MMASESNTSKYPLPSPLLTSAHTKTRGPLPPLVQAQESNARAPQGSLKCLAKLPLSLNLGGHLAHKGLLPGVSPCVAHQAASYTNRGRAQIGRARAEAKGFSPGPVWVRACLVRLPR